jgi:hypothetical protein
MNGSVKYSISRNNIEALSGKALKFFYAGKTERIPKDKRRTMIKSLDFHPPAAGSPASREKSREESGGLPILTGGAQF